MDSPRELTHDERVRLNSTKEQAWNLAATLVSPLIMEYGLTPTEHEDYRISPVDQHIEIIKSVADWILEP